MNKMNELKKDLLKTNETNLFPYRPSIKIEVKLNDKDCGICPSPLGDWIDLTTSKEYNLKKGDFELIDLGLCVKLPHGTEAHIVPRSSTFKNYGIIQTNGIGIIDNSYCGNKDVWKMPVYATRDVTIPKHVRIAQFRIFANQPLLYPVEVDSLNSKDRGGFGSTGV